MSSSIFDRFYSGPEVTENLVTTNNESKTESNVDKSINLNNDPFKKIDILEKFSTSFKLETKVTNLKALEEKYYSYGNSNLDNLRKDAILNTINNELSEIEAILDKKVSEVVNSKITVKSVVPSNNQPEEVEEDFVEDILNSAGEFFDVSFGGGDITELKERGEIENTSVDINSSSENNTTVEVEMTELEKTLDLKVSMKKLDFYATFLEFKGSKLGKNGELLLTLIQSIKEEYIKTPKILSTKSVKGLLSNINTIIFEYTTTKKINLSVLDMTDVPEYLQDIKVDAQKELKILSDEYNKYENSIVQPLSKNIVDSKILSFRDSSYMKQSRINIEELKKETSIEKMFSNVEKELSEYKGLNIGELEDFVSQSEDVELKKYFNINKENIIKVLNDHKNIIKRARVSFKLLKEERAILGIDNTTPEIEERMKADLLSIGIVSNFVNGLNDKSFLLTLYSVGESIGGFIGDINITLYVLERLFGKDSQTDLFIGLLLIGSGYIPQLSAYKNKFLVRKEEGAKNTDKLIKSDLEVQKGNLAQLEKLIEIFNKLGEESLKTELETLKKWSIYKTKNQFSRDVLIKVLKHSTKLTSLFIKFESLNILSTISEMSGKYPTGKFLGIRYTGIDIKNNTVYDSSKVDSGRSGKHLEKIITNLETLISETAKLELLKYHPNLNKKESKNVSKVSNEIILETANSSYIKANKIIEKVKALSGVSISDENIKELRNKIVETLDKNIHPFNNTAITLEIRNKIKNDVAKWYSKLGARLFRLTPWVNVDYLDIVEQGINEGEREYKVFKDKMKGKSLAENIKQNFADKMGNDLFIGKKMQEYIKENIVTHTELSEDRIKELGIKKPTVIDSSKLSDISRGLNDYLDSNYNTTEKNAKIKVLDTFLKDFKNGNIFLTEGDFYNKLDLIINDKSILDYKDLFKKVDTGETIITEKGLIDKLTDSKRLFEKRIEFGLIISDIKKLNGKITSDIKTKETLTNSFDIKTKEILSIRGSVDLTIGLEGLENKSKLETIKSTLDSIVKIEKSINGFNPDIVKNINTLINDIYTNIDITKDVELDPRLGELLGDNGEIEKAKKILAEINLNENFKNDSLAEIVKRINEGINSKNDLIIDNISKNIKPSIEIYNFLKTRGLEANKKIIDKMISDTDGKFLTEFTEKINQVGKLGDLEAEFNKGLKELDIIKIKEILDIISETKQLNLAKASNSGNVENGKKSSGDVYESTPETKQSTSIEKIKNIYEQFISEASKDGKNNLVVELTRMKGERIMELDKKVKLGGSIEQVDINNLIDELTEKSKEETNTQEIKEVVGEKLTQKKVNEFAKRLGLELLLSKENIKNIYDQFISEASKDGKNALVVELTKMKGERIIELDKKVKLGGSIEQVDINNLIDELTEKSKEEANTQEIKEVVGEKLTQKKVNEFAKRLGLELLLSNSDIKYSKFLEKIQKAFNSSETMETFKSNVIKEIGFNGEIRSLSELVKTNEFRSLWEKSLIDKDKLPKDKITKASLGRIFGTESKVLEFIERVTKKSLKK